MSSFVVLKAPNGIRFTLEKLDLSIAILPGVLGRQVTYADIGMRVTIPSTAPSGAASKPLEFHLAMPFIAEDGEVVDLVPALERRDIANLVFSNNAPAPTPNGAAHEYFDGEKNIWLTRIATEKAEQYFKDKGRSASAWRLETSRIVNPSECIYLRVRFRVAQAGAVWAWISSARRHSHAVADLRVNDLRSRVSGKNAPNFDIDTLKAEFVNCFLAVPSNLKAGNTNPVPAHVRVLEGKDWERYLGRRIGTKKSVMIITNWEKKDVSIDNPFRAFMEVDRRRPTAMRAALTASVVSILWISLLSSPGAFNDSVLYVGLSSLRYIIAGVSIASLLAIWRFIVPLVADRRYRLILKAVRAAEDRKFKTDHTI